MFKVMAVQGRQEFIGRPSNVGQVRAFGKQLGHAR